MCSLIVSVTCGAQVLASTLARDHLGIDLSRGDVVTLARRDAGKAFVVPQVEIGLGAVVGDVNLAVLIGAHGARIDVEVGIELAQADLIAAGLKQGAESGGGETLSK